MRDRFINRREALTLALAAAGSLMRPTRAAEFASAAQSGAAPVVGGSRLVIRNARPLDAESPIEALRTFETRNDLFFVRSHHALPTEGSTAWTLAIDGEVARPVTFQLEDIRRMRAEHRSATIECAGNGRGRLELPTTSGVQWGQGAVSTATWTGVPLAALLERAGVRCTSGWRRPIAVRCLRPPRSSAVFRARPRSARRLWPTR